MRFEAKLYNVLTKSKLIDLFANKTVDRVLMKEYYTILENKDTFSRYIFNVLDIACSNMRDSKKDFSSHYEENADFFKEVILSVKEIATLDINEDTYTKLWIYIIFCTESDILSLHEKIRILESMSITADSSKVEICFQILYIGELIDKLIYVEPIDLNRVRNLSRLLTEKTAFYNATLN